MFFSLRHQILCVLFQKVVFPEPKEACNQINFNHFCCPFCCLFPSAACEASNTLFSSALFAGKCIDVYAPYGNALHHLRQKIDLRLRCDMRHDFFQAFLLYLRICHLRDGSVSHDTAVRIGIRTRIVTCNHFMVVIHLHRHARIRCKCSRLPPFFCPMQVQTDVKSSIFFPDIISIIHRHDKHAFLIHRPDPHNLAAFQNFS